MMNVTFVLLFFFLYIYIYIVRQDNFLITTNLFRMVSGALHTHIYIYIYIYIYINTKDKILLSLL